MVKRFTPFRLFIAIVLTVFFSGMGYILRMGGLYRDYLDKFSGAVARGDQSVAKESLEDLEYFYQLNRKFDAVGLGWVSRRYLFYESDTVYYRAASNYIAGDHKRVVSDLQGEDDFWAYYLRANANWRIAQGTYVNALNLPDKTDKDKAEKEKQLRIADELAKTVVKDDYEQAVRNDPLGLLPPSWDYDLVSNDASRNKGLQPKPAQVKVKLGEKQPGAGNDGPGLKGKSGDGKAGTKPKDLDQKKGETPGADPNGGPRRKG